MEKKKTILDWWVNIDKSGGIKLKDVPENFKDSLNRYMYGQTCTLDEETGELIFYSWDVEEWVYLNQDKQI